MDKAVEFRRPDVRHEVTRTLLATARTTREIFRTVPAIFNKMRPPGERRCKKAIEMNYSSARKPIGTIAHTGESCPESGVWQSIDTPSTTAPIAKGNRMPPHNGKAVSWKLVRYA